MSEPSGPERLAVKSLKDVRESIDFRLNIVSRPTAEQLDESLTHQLSNFLHVDLEKQTPVVEPEPEPLYVEFEDGDKRDPVYYPNLLKWIITGVGCSFTLLASSTTSTYTMGFPSMMRDLDCTSFQATVGLSAYALGFSIVPLVSTSFSEEVGRRPLYIISLLGHLLMHITVALSKNINIVIVARFFAGGFGSTGATMVGGTIADIWRSHERSLPMAIYSLLALGGSGLGPVAAGWVEMNPHLQWRWIQWIHAIITGIVLLLVVAVMEETRSTVLLTRLARKIRKERGDHRYRSRAEDVEGNLRTLIYVSCTRPLYLLVTEPTVLSISLWIGFAWGVFFCLIESIGPIFKNIHGFSQGQVGLSFLFIVIGSVFGFSTNFYQERLYQAYFSKRGPEARLYASCAAAALFPTGMFIFAWSSSPHVHWIVLIIGMSIFAWAIFTMYLAVFTYIADCYGSFASSASAGQSLFRNLMGMAFPLFTEQMLGALTYKWANTLFATVAVLMIPIPYVLFFYGPRIRGHSKFLRMIHQKEMQGSEDSGAKLAC